MASDEITSTPDQHLSVSNEGERSCRDQYSSETLDGFRPAVVLLACDYPNKMQSDLTLVSAPAHDQALLLLLTLPMT